MKAKNFFKTYIFLICAFIAVQSCDYNKEEVLYPQASACDTSDTKFSSRVNIIFQNNCVTCHGPGGSNADYPLTNFEQISTDPELIYARMTDSGDPMPPSGPLNPCEIAAFRKWIDNGKLNN